MNNPKVAFDESGNTGQDLLSRDQPVFVLAAVHMTDDEARDLLAAGGFHAGKEFHFKEEKKLREGPDRILAMLAELMPRAGTAKTVVYHKKYMIVTKIVDLLVEEFLHRRGVDLYQQGRNIGLSNMWYAVIPNFCGQESFDELLRSFVHMIRNKRDADVDAFFHAVEQLALTTREPRFKDYDVPLLKHSRAVVPSVLAKADKTDLDPALPAFFELAVYWNEAIPKIFDILHDRSKPIENQEAILRSFMAPEEPDVVIGWDRRKAKLPIRTTGIRFVDSDDEPLVQVADLVAGAVAHRVRGNIDRKYRDFLWRELRTVNIEAFVAGTVWPHDAVTPQELGTEEVGGEDPNDYLADMIQREEARQRDAGVSDEPGRNNHGA